MKKMLAIVMVAVILSAMMVPVSAADEKINVMTNAAIGITWGLLSNSKYVPANMWDGNNVYNADAASSYCDFKFASSKTAPLAADYPKVDIYGNEGTPESVYYCTFEVELDAIYKVDTLVFYSALFGASANIDGFDIWLGVNGKDDYKKVFSVNELVCGSKYEKHAVEGSSENAKFTAEFEATEAKYMVFGLTGYRCQHAEALALIGLEPNANPHYFRIAELELMGYATEQPETTPAPVETTTPAPVETTTPAPVETTTVGVEPTPTEPVETTPAPAPVETTPAPVEDKGGCGSVVALGLIPMLAVAFVAVKKRRD